MKLLVTGGAGFIGSAIVRRAVSAGLSVVTVDALTYAGCLDNIASVADNPLHAFEKADIRDGAALREIFDRHRPDAVMHLAAESHVDRSIDAPAVFLETNVLGTSTLLQAARAYWERTGKPQTFRFLHVSTDEVYGELGASGKFTEVAATAPSSPYAASKAASDHVVGAWHRTYGLPIGIARCCNTFGPHQFPEKLIPVVVRTALDHSSIPLYGDGENVREWLYVEDTADALLTVLRKGIDGRIYNVGGGHKISNRALVEAICGLLDILRPAGAPYAGQIAFVTDRPGHDFRYALDPTRIRTELEWSPTWPFAMALERTVQWYLENEAWWHARMENGAHKPAT
ncbi:dTDP-glucose 4,6-dehydratase [Tropicimonas isoalkanivorans]|uniref:dTDP-glucose 4,6-dehydratase n=1 Tax=Tropicimonas isoalkanivorans TaxID=441112 RepID=A0A1I1KYH9_9RHOB|nr:dTDP-glucose 4,6-dehydratase [Tropicimonas isoalkanivorans]SFC65876.1 dTDP-glucose 4,6-dehydratase [Tropicimonas isoalkanivorans]